MCTVGAAVLRVARADRDHQAARRWHSSSGPRRLPATCSEGQLQSTGLEPAEPWVIDGGHPESRTRGHRHLRSQPLRGRCRADLPRTGRLPGRLRGRLLQKGVVSVCRGRDLEDLHQSALGQQVEHLPLGAVTLSRPPLRRAFRSAAIGTPCRRGRSSRPRSRSIVVCPLIPDSPADTSGIVARSTSPTRVTSVPSGGLGRSRH